MFIKVVKILNKVCWLSNIYAYILLSNIYAFKIIHSRDFSVIEVCLMLYRRILLTEMLVVWKSYVNILNIILVNNGISTHFILKLGTKMLHCFICLKWVKCFYQKL